jgi:hypothetical protein
MRQAAIITRLTELLSDRGSWCGETHVQKAAYFLQELTGVPTGFDFVLYKHGPFSFDLRGAIAGYRADDLVSIVPREYPYGPSFRATEAARRLWSRYPKTLGQHEKAIAFVADALGNMNVAELEQHATALFVSSRTAQIEIAVAEISELKPHISAEAARAALQHVRELRRSWNSVQRVA